jgi:hypothetical protein
MVGAALPYTRHASDDRSLANLFKRTVPLTLGLSGADHAAFC